MNQKKRRLDNYHKKYDKQYQKRLLELRSKQLEHISQTTNNSHILSQPKPSLEELNKSIEKKQKRLIACIVSNVLLGLVTAGSIAIGLSSGLQIPHSADQKANAEQQRQNIIDNIGNNETFKSAYLEDLNKINDKYTLDEIDFNTYSEKLAYLNSEQYIYDNFPNTLENLDNEIAIKDNEIKRRVNTCFATLGTSFLALGALSALESPITQNKVKLAELKKEKEENYEHFA